MRRAPRAAALVSLLATLGACVTTVPAPSAAPRPVKLSAAELATRGDYARLEREVADELNRLRRDPRGYAASLAATLDEYRGTLRYRPGSRTAVATREGPAAVREAVEELRRQAPVSTLERSEGLALGARDHALDQGRSGSVGHAGSDGTRAMQRVSRYGQWNGRMSESIAYGRFTRGADVVMMLLVDDGVPDRGHRRNALDRTARLAGVACAPHARYGAVCVIEQASGYTETYAAR